MSAPISNSIDCSRPRRDYASGRIDFDRINAEALGCLDAICRRLTSTRRPGSPSTSARRRAFNRRTRPGVFGVGSFTIDQITE
jgi:hypothetical protein